MKIFEFAYDKSRYATKKELEQFNTLIKEKIIKNSTRVLYLFM